MSAPNSLPPRADEPSAEPRSVLDWVRDEGEAARVLGDMERILRRRRRRHVRIASSLACVGLIGVAGLLWQPWQTRPQSPVTAGIVAVVRPEARALADGSRVELKPGAEVAVEFSPTLRRVVLQRGTAHFAVAKDSTRPFVVLAQGYEVRAVGTEFSVELTSGAVEVLVNEGRVELDGGGAANAAGPVAQTRRPALAALSAGDQAIVDFGATQPRRSALSAEQVRSRLAWRVPRLEFSDTPLARALALCNEHGASHGGPRLGLADPALGDLRVSGVLRADDLDPFLRLLEGEFGLTAETRAGEILLRRR